MSWTDERVELLRKLAGDGLSATEIAAELGGVTRNAVIGKCARINVPLSGRLGRKPNEPRRPRTKTNVVVVQPDGDNEIIPASEPQKKPLRQFADPTGVGVLAVAKQEKDSYAGSKNLTLFELEDRQCRRIVGRNDKNESVYCGCKTENRKVQECPYHHERSTRGLKEKEA
jgi:GcrA cell cycle regulator